MSKVKELIGSVKRPISNLLPQTHASEDTHNLQFRNLQHFKYVVSKLTARGMSESRYKEVLNRLIKGISGVSQEEYEDIQRLVKSKLHKRGLITSEVYEEFKYTDSGVSVGIDVGKYAAGEPECVVTPTQQYVGFFHELFINISYECGVSNELVKRSCAKLLATIEELEKQRIFIKITLVLPINKPDDENLFYSSIPLFSHNEKKDFHTMASVVNADLLRVFYFAILEDFYGKDLVGGYGNPIGMPNTMNVGKEFNEIAFFEEIKELAR